MFKYNRGAELTQAVLQKMLNRFVHSVRPQLIKYKDYYDGKQAISTKSYQDTNKPCSKTVVNYCKNIADSYCGYLATPDYISYRSTTDIEELMDILKYNDYQTEDADFLLDALVYGVGCELMYIDTQAQTRFKLISPTECFGIYDDSLTNDLLYFVRFYKKNEWDDTDDYLVDVYSDFDVKHYQMTGLSGNLELLGEEPHYFSQCPANIFYLKDEKPIYECVMSLQDAYNELLSCEIDDFSAFVDAYLALIGVDAEPEDIQAMKENRVLILPEGAVAQWLTKNSTDTQIENILKRLQDSIYRIAQCPDFSSESFIGGVSSGVAIRYRLTGMETRAGKVCAELKKALLRRIEVICGIATLKYGEEMFQDIDIDFKRNIPEDDSTIINTVNALKGTVSDATLLAQLPFVSDVNNELELLKQQKAENMALYNFGPVEEETEE